MATVTEGAEQGGRLIVRQADPFNAETPLGPGSSRITPIRDSYVRAHFPVPEAGDGSLTISGAVDRENTLSLDDLRAMALADIDVTMECAGNGRESLSPPVSGVPWGLFAVATSSWTGTSLRTLLDRSGVANTACEVTFRGRDQGMPSRGTDTVNYERSLPIAHAVVSETLVAIAMNGQPIPSEHGGPVRLIVPGWYGMASVKWLDRITVVTEPFRGFYQVDDYVMRTGKQVTPCREMAVRSLILGPEDGSSVAAGVPVMICGFAWSGFGAVERVDVSTDGGTSWNPAVVTSGTRFSWSSWSMTWTPNAQGEYSILARATDAAGNVQPLNQVWNLGGYGNNCAVPTRVIVHSSSHGRA